MMKLFLTSKIIFSVPCLGIILFLVGCLGPMGQPAQPSAASETAPRPAPAYTPVVAATFEAGWAPDVTFVSIEQLNASPAAFENLLIEVVGYNRGRLIHPDLLPYIESWPPVEWAITIDRDNYEHSAVDQTIYIQNLSEEAESLGEFRIPKEVAVKGWWRLYEGKIGGSDGPIRRVWYLEAVQLQFLECIDATSPGCQD